MRYVQKVQMLNGTEEKHKIVTRYKIDHQAANKIKVLVKKVTYFLLNYSRFLDSTMRN